MEDVILAGIGLHKVLNVCEDIFQQQLRTPEKLGGGTLLLQLLLCALTLLALEIMHDKQDKQTNKTIQLRDQNKQHSSPKNKKKSHL